MTWSPHLIDLTRPMTRQTIIELAGKIVAEDSPYNEVKVNWLRNWDTDNGTLCQWTLRVLQTISGASKRACDRLQA